MLFRWTQTVFDTMPNLNFQWIAELFLFLVSVSSFLKNRSDNNFYLDGGSDTNWRVVTIKYTWVAVWRDTSEIPYMCFDTLSFCNKTLYQIDLFLYLEIKFFGLSDILCFCFPHESVDVIHDRHSFLMDGWAQNEIMKYECEMCCNFFSI